MLDPALPAMPAAPICSRILAPMDSLVLLRAVQHRLRERPWISSLSGEQPAQNT